MTEHNYYHVHHRRQRHRRLALVALIALLIGTVLTLVETCSQRLKAPEVYTPKDLERYHWQQQKAVEQQQR